MQDDDTTPSLSRNNILNNICICPVCIHQTLYQGFGGFREDEVLKGSAIPLDGREFIGDKTTPHFRYERVSEDRWGAKV